MIEAGGMADGAERCTFEPSNDNVPSLEAGVFIPEVSDRFHFLAGDGGANSADTSSKTEPRIS